MVLLRGSPG